MLFAELSFGVSASRRLSTRIISGNEAPELPHCHVSSVLLLLCVRAVRHVMIHDDGNDATAIRIIPGFISVYIP